MVDSIDSAAIAAVSARSLRGPSEIICAPDFDAIWTSLSENPPSGPTMIASESLSALILKGLKHYLPLRGVTSFFAPF